MFFATPAETSEVPTLRASIAITPSYAREPLLLSPPLLSATILLPTPRAMGDYATSPKVRANLGEA